MGTTRGGTTGEPPISAELWARMRALDAYCRMSFARDVPYRVEWRGLRRVWHAHVRDQRAMHHESVAVEHPRLAEALRLAVEEAERRGYHLPREDRPNAWPEAACE